MMKKRKVNSANSNNNNNNNKIDRLSSLPNTLLAKILSLLPIQSAAATSVLSPRWRRLWTHVTALHLDSYSLPRIRYYVNPPTPSLESFLKFLTIVDDILYRLKFTTKIHIFDLLVRCGTDDTQLCSAKLNTWVQKICGRHMDVIKVSIYGPPIITLPTSLFNNETVTLLIEGTDFMLPRNLESFCLPNLKKLSLSQLVVCPFHVQLMAKLFMDCPLLEYLCLGLRFTEDVYVFDIASSNLKCLSLRICESSHTTKIVVDAPELEQIELTGNLVFYHFVRVPTMLLTADIHLDTSSCDSGTNYHSYIMGLFRGISSVRSLFLHDTTISVFASHQNVADGVLPVFHNLNHLCLGSFYNEETEWVPPLPIGSLSKVKRIEISEVFGNDNELKLIEYIVRNATVLERLHVSACGEENHGSARLWKEYKFCAALSKLSRSFPTCQIEFSGDYLSASGVGLREESLGCKVCPFA